MTYYAVDRGANAVGVALEVKIGRDAPTFNCVVIDPLVYFGGGDAWLDMLGNIIEYPDIDSGRALNAFDLFRAFKERTGNYFVPIKIKTFEAAINGSVAFLVFLSASTPTFIVASGLWAVVVHSKLLIRCLVA